MSDCLISGCRELEWKCAKCGRVASTATFGDRWISVKDRPIPKDIPVIVWNGSSQFIVVWENDIDDWMTDCGCDGWEHNRIKIVPTHWAPLQDPPRKKPTRFIDEARIKLQCPDCLVDLIACNPPTIAQCSECATIWELPGEFGPYDMRS